MAGREGKARSRLAVVLFGILPLLLGLPFLAWQARQSLDGEAAAIQEFVVARVDAILGHASNAAVEVAGLVGSPCPAAGLDLRRG